VTPVALLRDQAGVHQLLQVEASVDAGTSRVAVRRSKDETSIKPYTGVKRAFCSNFSGMTILVKSQRLMELL